MYGVTDLREGDEIEVIYETDRSPYTQTRYGEVGEIGEVTDADGPTGTPEIVLTHVSRSENGPAEIQDHIIWPETDAIRTESAGHLGEVIKFSRQNVDDGQLRLG